jgi:hypothetical protein
MTKPKNRVEVETPPMTAEEYAELAAAARTEFPLEHAEGIESAKRFLKGGAASFRKHSLALAIHQLTHRNSRHNKNGLGPPDYAKIQGYADHLGGSK